VIRAFGHGNPREQPGGFFVLSSDCPGADGNNDGMPNPVARAFAITAISMTLAFCLTDAGVSLAAGRTETARTGRLAVSGRAVSGGFPMIPAGPDRTGAQPGTGTADITSAGSLNWAGYAVTKSRVRFTSVRATFFVPYLNCPKSPGAALSSAWVGFDGFLRGARSVEQGGIAANCSAAGKATYFAWWEMFPRAEVRAPLRIAAGDSMTASVTFSAKTRNYKITITDNTRGARFTVQRKCPHVKAGRKLLRCPRNSAEIISEAPATGAKLRIAHLADFGAVSFAAIAIADNRGARAGIVSARWNAAKITELRSSDGPAVARPTTTAAGTFDTYWLREG
jgi:Peptidase A4 family